MENTNVTLREVAQRVGVSMVSVSRALSGKEGVSEATRKRILETAEEMGYTANLAASALKKKRATVAIILPEAQNAGAYYFNYMWKGCHEYIQENSIYPISFLEFPYALYRSNSEEEPLLAKLDEVYAQYGSELDGLITVPATNSSASRESLKRFVDRGIRVVLIDNDVGELNRLCCIAPNDENTGRLGAELMCSMIWQQSGTILIAAGKEDSPSHRMNTIGFTDYIRTHRPELNVMVINDSSPHPSADRYYECMSDPAIIAAYSVRARNTIPLCNAALRLEAKRKLLLVGSDLFDESADMLRRGVLKAIIYKNPYQKGYEAIKTLSEVLVKDKAPKAESITVPISVILRNNLMFFEEFI